MNKISQSGTQIVEHGSGTLLKANFLEYLIKIEETVLENENSCSGSANSLPKYSKELNPEPLRNTKEGKDDAKWKPLIDKIFIGQKSEAHEVLKKKRHSFNKIFLQIRSILKFDKISRRTQFDSLVKKAKAKIFKIIHDTMKKCFVPEYKLEKIPQSFITNIKIEINKSSLNKTLLELYQEYEIITSVEDLLERKAIKKEKTEIFLKLLHMTFREIYDYYLTSIHFMRNIHKLKNREGEKFSILFLFISVNFIQYFNSGRGNISRKQKNHQIESYEKPSEVSFSDVEKKNFFKIINRGNVMMNIFEEKM